MNEGLEPNQIVSPENLHTEPPFVRPVYEQEVVEEPPVVKPKAKAKKKRWFTIKG